MCRWDLPFVERERGFWLTPVDCFFLLAIDAISRQRGLLSVTCTTGLRSIFDRPWSILVVLFMSTTSDHRSVSIKRKAHLLSSLPNIDRRRRGDKRDKEEEEKERSIAPVDFLSRRSTDLVQRANTVSKVVLTRPRFIRRARPAQFFLDAFHTDPVSPLHRLWMVHRFL